jgi:hypothetical protein
LDGRGWLAWESPKKCLGSMTVTRHLLPILAGYGINAYATNAAWVEAIVAAWTAARDYLRNSGSDTCRRRRSFAKLSSGNFLPETGV